MNKFIDTLKERPAHHRRRIAMQISACITAVVFVVWISTLGVRLANGIQNGAVAQSGASQLVAATAAAGSDLMGQFGQIKSSLQSVGDVSADNSDTTYGTTQTYAPATTSAPAVVLSTDASGNGSYGSTNQ